MSCVKHFILPIHQTATKTTWWSWIFQPLWFLGLRGSCPLGLLGKSAFVLPWSHLMKPEPATFTAKGHETGSNVTSRQMRVKKSTLTNKINEFSCHWQVAGIGPLHNQLSSLQHISWLTMSVTHRLCMLVAAHNIWPSHVMIRRPKWEWVVAQTTSCFLLSYNHCVKLWPVLKCSFKRSDVSCMLSNVCYH